MNETAAFVIEKILVPFLAALVGAIAAFIYQKRLLKHNDKKYVLASLMAFRNVGTTEPEFVKALNLIDVLYHDNKKVKELMHEYLETCRSEHYSGGQRLSAFYNLVVEMAKEIGYDISRDDARSFFVLTSLNAPQPTLEKKENP